MRSSYRRQKKKIDPTCSPQFEYVDSCCVKKTDQIMSLSTASKSLPASYKKKLAKTQDQLCDISNAASIIKDRLGEYKVLWETLLPLLDLLYTEAVADNGKYEIGLKVPSLPDPGTSVAAKTRYINICLYMALAVSHCKSLSLDRYNSIDIGDILRDLNENGDSMVTDKVPALSTEQHVENIRKLFGDEDLEDSDTDDSSDQESLVPSSSNQVAIL